MQKCRGAELKKYSGAVVDKVLRCLRGAEVEVVLQRYRAADMEMLKC